MNKDLLDKVNTERLRQDKMWGEQNYNPTKWILILMEEVGELCSEILELNNPVIEKELVEVIAVAVVMWESGKRNGWL